MLDGLFENGAAPNAFLGRLRDAGTADGDLDRRVRGFYGDNTFRAVSVPASGASKPAPARELKIATAHRRDEERSPELATCLPASGHERTLTNACVTLPFCAREGAAMATARQGNVELIGITFGGFDPRGEDLLAIVYLRAQRPDAATNRWRCQRCL